MFAHFLLSPIRLYSPGSALRVGVFVGTPVVGDSVGFDVVGAFVGDFVVGAWVVGDFVGANVGPLSVGDLVGLAERGTLPPRM